MKLNQTLLVLAAFGIILVALAASKMVSLTALTDLVVEPLGSPAGWRDTLREMTPLLILGTSVFLALKAGLFNIGADGQFLVGALAAAVVALRFAGPAGWLGGMLAGSLVGGLWAWPAGLIKAYRNGHEVITTIMLNNVARFLTTALAAGVFKDPGKQEATTSSLKPSEMLPKIIHIDNFNMNLAWILGLGCVVLAALWFRKTVAGYELSAVGANPKAAALAGIDSRKVTVWAMAASGALAGLAGSLSMLAYEGRFYADFSPGYGFDALGVALLAGGSAWGILPSSFLFGVLAKGTSAIQLHGVPKGLGGVLLGLIIIVFASFRYRKEANLSP